MKLINQVIPIKTSIGRMTTDTVQARVINARWCAFQHYGYPGWSLTHRATGYSAGKGLETFQKARVLALALEKAYPPKRWVFTDPNAVRGMKKARPLIRKHGGYLS